MQKRNKLTNTKSDFNHYVGYFPCGKAIVNIVMSVHPPARMEQLGCYWMDIHEI
jgi:hypothetical protein